VPANGDLADLARRRDLAVGSTSLSSTPSTGTPMDPGPRRSARLKVATGDVSDSP
jgi:hypothetical protein